MRLYKYFPLEKGLSWLRTRRLYFTPPRFFNDPFEFRPVAWRTVSDRRLRSILRTARFEKIVREAFTRMELFSGRPEEFHDWYEARFHSLFPQLAKDIRRTNDDIEEQFQLISSTYYGVCSLSRINNDVLMWSHYADSHAGMVIGYDLDDTVFPNTELAPVRYSRTRFRAKPQFFMGWPGKRMVAAMRTKSRHWSYEREYRLIRFLSECETEVADGNELFYMTVPTQTISTVIVGANALQDARERVSLVISCSPPATSSVPCHR